jgi:hypothetical protein
MPNSVDFVEVERRCVPLKTYTCVFCGKPVSQPASVTDEFPLCPEHTGGVTILRKVRAPFVKLLTAR